MITETILSLCYMNSQTEKSVQLYRLADLVDGEYIPYVFESAFGFFETERDIVWGSKKDLTGDIGSVGVYRWSAYQDISGEWRTSTYEHEALWVEVIVTNRETLAQVVALLRTGLKLSLPNSKKHDLVVCCKPVGSDADAVYVPSHLWENVGGLCKLSENAESLDTGIIDLNRDTASLRCRNLTNDSFRYLRCTGAGQKTGAISVRSREEIIALVVNNYVRQQLERKDGVITRKERQGFAAVLPKLTASSFADELAQQLECTNDEAMQYASDYLAKLQVRFEKNDVEWMILQLLESDSEYAHALHAAAENKWRETHSSDIAQAEATLRQRGAELDALAANIETAKRELENLNAQKERCEADVLAADEMRADVEKQIAARIAGIREERAKALVDEAWLMAASSSETVSKARGKADFTIEWDNYGDLVDEVSIAESFHNAEIVWKTLCADVVRGAAAMTFFMAAYALRQSLVITGECAEQIADMAASLVTGRGCTKVSLTAESNTMDVIKELSAVPHECICFVNGLEQNYDAVRTVMHHFSNSQFMVTVRHSESLAMEPDSLFTTFLPVYSEEFCACAYVLYPERLSCKNALGTSVTVHPAGKQLRPFRTGQAGWFSTGFFAPLMVERCAQMSYAVKAISNCFADSENRAKRAMLSMVYMPLMKCLRRSDVLGENRVAFSIFDPVQANRMLLFAGLEKE